MNIIPAIDIRNGKCVRLYQGDFKKETVYGNPTEIAKMWESKGAKKLHIVDLDGAKNANMKNLNSIKKIIKAVKIPLQVGGGIRSQKTIDILCNLGIKTIILGSILFDDQILFEKIIKKYKDVITVSIDVKNEIVMTNGWLNNTKKSIWETLLKLESLGLKKIIFTDINCDGTLLSPNFSLIKKILQKTNIKIIVSGGVSFKKQIQALENVGIEEVIVGKALYEGKIKIC